MQELGFWVNGHPDNFLQDIHLLYLFLKHSGANSEQYLLNSSQIYVMLIFVRCLCKCKKGASLRIEPFPHNHSNYYALTGFNGTRQGNPECNAKGNRKFLKDALPRHHSTFENWKIF